MRRSALMLRAFLALATLLLAAAPSLSAQRLNQPAPQPGAQGQRGLELQFRQRLAEVVRRRLNLNDSQMRQLGQVNDRFERDRVRLLREERQVRQALRAEVLAGDSANQQKVADLLDRALRIQRDRLDLTEREQRELATFMTPTQRAKYFGIQDELRRRMEEIREQQRRAAAPGRAFRRPLPEPAPFGRISS